MQDLTKYYTPELEEFHVGFEYEVDFGNINTTSPGWNKATYQLNGSWLNNEEDLQMELDQGKFRVKYLDKEDIESLGFKKVVNSYRHHFEKDDNKLAWWWDKKGIEISKITKSGIGQKCIFSGTIRNKSELKRLLKQLDI